MRFLTLTLVALMPMTAMADERITMEDLTDVYEYVDAEMAGNSCKAESLNGKQACQITCVSWENAVCSSTETRAHCACVPTTRPPKDLELVR